jgi:transposase-like protein
MVSHLHHLFNSETCQAYIHTLRWKDRPLQCPRCQSLNVGPWGIYHAQPGLKRYHCKEKGCKRTFNRGYAAARTRSRAGDARCRPWRMRRRLSCRHVHP